MNRRSLFTLLGGAAVATAAGLLVPEYLARKTYFIPPTGGWVGRKKIALLIDNDQMPARVKEEYEYLTVEQAGRYYGAAGDPEWDRLMAQGVRGMSLMDCPAAKPIFMGMDMLVINFRDPFSLSTHGSDE